MLLMTIFFILAGLFEEKLNKDRYFYEGKHYQFQYEFLKILLQGVFMLIISEICLFVYTPKNVEIQSPITFADKVLLGTYNSLCKVSTETSLRYLDFITRVIAKSCKSASIVLVLFLYKIPIFGDILKKVTRVDKIVKDVNLPDFIKVTLTCTSMVLFGLEEAPGQIQSFSKNALIGYALISVSLIVDGLTAIKEDCINHEVHTKKEYAHYKSILCWDYMKIFSLFSLIFAVAGIIYYCAFTEFLNEIHIFLYDQTFLMNLISACFYNAVGQVFIFQILEKYGPLTLTMITGVRKLLSILVSILYFNKEVSLTKTVALLLGSSIIVWEVVEKSFVGKKEKEKEKAQ